MKRKFALILTVVLSCSWLDAQNAYHPDRILIKSFDPNIRAFHDALGSRVITRFKHIPNIYVVEIPRLSTVPIALGAYRNSGLVERAEPDYYLQLTATPNDPKFTDGTLWGLNNVANDADIDAPEAWDIMNTAPNVIVAVIDTGVRYTHEDFAGNIWVNPGEIPGNGVDDDCNGYIDDIYGINAITAIGTALCSNPIAAGDPSDDVGHGTLVAGVIGAVGNNGKGVVGVAWNVKIMPLKFQDAATNGTEFTALECIDYAIEKGAKIINGSFGTAAGASVAFLDEGIAAARDKGIIYVAAPGNTDVIANPDNDLFPFFPASSYLDNIVSVAATDQNDGLASFSRYGLVSVDLGAPGANIYSTANSSDTSYAYANGTSVAVPYVSGALALMRRFFLFESYPELYNRLLTSTDPLASLTGKCQTGGRLNLQRALASSSRSPRNNNFANAFSIVFAPNPSEPNLSFTAIGNNVNGTKESGEPNHGGNAGGKSVWWSWTAPSTTTVTVKTENSGFNTLLAVYTGTSVSGLTLVAQDNDSCACGTSQVTFTAAAGTTYRIAVDGYNGASGTVNLNIKPGSASAPPDFRFVLSSLQRTANQFTAHIIGPPSRLSSFTSPKISSNGLS